MDILRRVISPGGPRFWLTHQDHTWLDTLRLQWLSGHPDVLVRLVRGHQMQSKASVLNELAAALQLPLYFGHNWDALEELLGDLSWYKFRAAILLVSDAEHVLMHADSFATPFFEILQHRAGDPALPPFACVFQALKDTPADVHQLALLMGRLGKAGIAPAVLTD
jgi:hypothetical protein